MGVWTVLRDPSFDYRLVAVGALAPIVLDAPWQHRGLAHTLIFAVGALVAVMALTTNRRELRRHLIALPVGLLAHLVLDGVWANKNLFWWPALGPWGASALAPSAAVVVARELAGLVVFAHVVRRFGLADPQRRREFLRTGRLAPC